ncbi:integrin alpha-M-like [Salminus brasiliensis]|uniref:integrin alpha-M-like n=1 Tax=Salminus brasiliensis TaxID=930266 RepID=UPI003B833F8C
MEPDHTQLPLSLGVQRLYSALLFILPFSCGFNLDTKHPKIFPSPKDGRAFGHQVCHFGSEPRDSVLVTDPLRGNGTGGVYRCFYDKGQCEPVHVDVQPGSAFGLSLACSDHRALVGFLKSKSTQIPDQQGVLETAPSGEEGANTPGDCQTTETAADEETAEAADAQSAT